MAVSNAHSDNIESKLDQFLALLSGVKKTQSGWLAFCPGHDDRNKSKAAVCSFFPEATQ